MRDATTSTANEKVRYLRSLQDHKSRLRAQCFVIEGVRLVTEALDSGVELELALVDEGALKTSEAGRSLLDRLPDHRTYGAPARVLASAAGTVHPQGIVASLPFLAPVAQPSPSPGLILDAVQDPGNLGTIMRSAAASGAGPLLLAPGCVDVYNPKVVRAAMGAHFRLSFRQLDWDALRDDVEGIPVWLAETEAELDYDTVDWTAPAYLLLGGEANGVGASGRALATGSVAIPMQDGVESLNVAIAASVIMFEARRQRARLIGSTQRRRGWTEQG